ncbi:MAG: iron-containing alcohol dehydrogenase [Akkermansiaceae bacterium]|nr:iron-containing alcohol dehydrogenase [Armatimonadota bacterium]
MTPGRVSMEWGGATNGHLADEAKRLGSRPLVVAGSSLAKSGILDAILASLHKAGLSPTVHTGVPPEPDLDALQAAMNAAEGADSVIAIGGGSVLDVAKGAAALGGTGHDARAYHSGKVNVPETVSRPILAVPTTAGTGSEATWVGVYTDKEAKRKASIRGGAMMPVTAFLDAELTVSCPPAVTAYSGMDAFVQAVEAYTSIGANPLTDSLSGKATKLISDSVVNAFGAPQSRQPREDMLLGSYLAGVALNTSRLGLVHGLAHPIGAITGAPHGLLCGLLMPAVTRFNAMSDLGNDPIRFMTGMKYDQIASGIIMFAENYMTGLGAETVAKYSERILRMLEIPSRLSEIGLREEHLDAVAKEAMSSGSTKANPRPVTEADARAVLESCL